MNESSFNVARHLRTQATKYPARPATILNSGRSIPFAQLDHECDRMMEAFQKRGIREGMRVAIFVRPGLDFVPVVFALFKIGAVPVFIDPGMKLKSMLQCLREVKPEAMVGVGLAHIAARLFRSAFASIAIRICIGRDLPAVAVKSSASRKFPLRTVSRPAVFRSADQLAAIIFTSGSTGVPKGVMCSHGQFEAQQRMLKQTYEIKDDEIDLVVFPLFALFSAVWGITAVISDLNPAKPAKASGRGLANAITKWNVTHSAGSPAIWRQLANYALDNGQQFQTLRRILTAGAPVSPQLVQDLKRIMPEGEVYTPYGATEALPLTTIHGDELIRDCFDKTRLGFGTCVGKPLAEISIKIIQTTDAPIKQLSADMELPQGSIGEVIVSGPIVTRSYFGREQATQMAKIQDGERVWHRMGDLGYFDANGRLWFCGRKDHRVRTAQGDIYPVRCEGLFNHDPRVPRSAVVGVGPNGAQSPVLIIEQKNRMKTSEKNTLALDLLSMAQSNPETENMKSVLFVDKFPVDVRHNIKINRPELAKYASRRLGVK